MKNDLMPVGRLATDAHASGWWREPKKKRPMKKDILNGLAVVSATAMLLALFFFALAATDGERTDSIGYQRAKAERVYRVGMACPCKCDCKRERGDGD